MWLDHLLSREIAVELCVHAFSSTGSQVGIDEANRFLQVFNT